jgi:hypothetical protein
MQESRARSVHSECLMTPARPRILAPFRPARKIETTQRTFGLFELSLYSRCG